VKLTRNEIIGLVLLAVGLIALVLLLPGLVGGPGPAPMRVLFGWGAVLVVLALILGGVAMLLSNRMGWEIRWLTIAGGELMFLALVTAAHLATRDPLTAALAGNGGGLLGWAARDALQSVMPQRAAWAVTVVVFGAGLFLLWLGLPERWTGAVKLRARRLRDAAAVWWAVHVRPGQPDDEMEALPDGGTTDSFETLDRAVLKPLRLPLRRIVLIVAALWPWHRQALDAEDELIEEPLLSYPRPLVPIPEAAAVAAMAERATAAVAKGKKKPAAKAKTPPAKAVKGDGRTVPDDGRPASLPPMSLLRADPHNRNAQSDAKQRAQLLKQALAEFGVPVEVVSIKEGPTVTQFGLEPGEIVKELRGGEVLRRRVSVHSIERLSNDLALTLSAASIRIEAPVPGRPYVGIEIPNSTKTMVSLRSVLKSPEFAKVTSPLAVALGRDVAGDPLVADLARLPHLLIAGATGSGKSVCINAVISSMLMNNGPERVRFLMVDPKMVELPAYNGIPHLYGQVITDPSQVTGALAWLTLQMDDRYRAFAARGVRNIEEYNRRVAHTRTAEPLPYIVLIIDELADLMMTAAFDVERQICRLGQMSRATGIHLVLATQRPSVDVITGLIKANFPARIAFAVTSQIDSRVILDTPGAEKLLGRGDMLFMAPDSAKLARIQGCYVSDQEIDGIVEFWKGNRSTSSLLEDAEAPWAGLVMAAENGKDELLERALELLQTKHQISTSMLQRQLRIGYPRAARLVEQLEEMGAVGPDEGGGRSREVLTRREAVEG
jgi:DNA segregation ATPase FtsK/SpoIIIE, S-DNA-T family